MKERERMYIYTLFPVRHVEINSPTTTPPVARLLSIAVLAVTKHLGKLYGGSGFLYFFLFVKKSLSLFSFFFW